MAVTAAVKADAKFSAGRTSVHMPAQFSGTAFFNGRKGTQLPGVDGIVFCGKLNSIPLRT
jgi:hypothetical protein